ncbi:DUF6402 family protein [Cupriavidus pauculus]|uniref:DUF6402 family protein n=1 Tax=Cupriavidus pauculus TaxID=82633 RepID=UPI001FD5674B|nr:DUF6402 family protein [Cupriavidus pauculus]
MSVATSILSPVSNRQGKVVEADVMYLDEIPVAMDRMGWRVSAALMRRWFSTKPAWAMPAHLRGEDAGDPRLLPASQVDSQIVKMKWLLEFPRVVPVFEDLCQGWNTKNGRDQLVKHLKKAGWSPGKQIKLGYGLENAWELDRTCQVNYRTFGSYFDTLDDLFGAIFNATLKLALVGKTSRGIFSNKNIFEIERMGVYVRDTYDFNARRYEDELFGLGIWSRKRCLTKLEIAKYKSYSNELRAGEFPGFVPVKNTDFRRWQHARNEGGDFYVFSDVMWLPVNVKYVAL